MTRKESFELLSALDAAGDALEDAAEILTFLARLVEEDHAEPHTLAAVARLAGKSVGSTSEAHAGCLNTMRHRLEVQVKAYMRSGPASTPSSAGDATTAKGAADADHQEPGAAAEDGTGQARPCR